MNLQTSEIFQPVIAAKSFQNPLANVPQPDANGEFACPADGAKFMASFGIPQIPLHGKKPFMDGWQDQGSTDFDQIDLWAKQNPACNFGSVAKLSVGKPFAFEADSLESSACR